MFGGSRQHVAGITCPSLIQEAADDYEHVRDVKTKGLRLFSALYYPDLYALSFPRAWEMVPLTWKAMWTPNWGHDSGAFSRKNHAWLEEWEASKYNQISTSHFKAKRTKLAPAGAKFSSFLITPAGAKLSSFASRHDINKSVGVPCLADSCDIFPCVNSKRFGLSGCDEARWLKEEGGARGISPWIGLFARADMPEGTWIASFGPLLWSSQRLDVGPANSTIAENGYSMYFTQIPTPLAHTSGWGTPKKGWRGKYWSPWINHTCCTFHCNTEFVADEEAETFNVKTTQDVAYNDEYLANYVAGYAAPHSVHFAALFGIQCACCACTHRTVHCHDC